MARIVQNSFTGGELSLDISRRHDLEKVKVGLRTCRNFVVEKGGGISNRPGTTWISEVKDSAVTPRLIQFEFSTEQTYIIEFGNLYIRIYKDGGRVLDSSATQAITGITLANPAVVTTGTHSWLNGQQVWISGVVGMTQVNNRRFVIANKTATTFELSGVDSLAYTAWSSGGSADIPYEQTSPYSTADLPGLKFTQSADTMTLVHEDYDPRSLTRTAHDNWVFSTPTYAPAVQPPTNGAHSVSGSLDFAVTSVALETGEESLPLLIPSGNAVSNGITWDAPVTGPTVEKFNVYQEDAGSSLLGYIGTTALPSEGFTTDPDSGIEPEVTDTPPKARTPFSGSAEKPQTVTYFQQRRLFAGSKDFPQTIFGSQIGAFDNMSVSTPLADSDAITYTIDANQVHRIEHLVALNDLICLTVGGEWRVSGDSDGSITPTSVKVRPQSYNGSDTPMPIVSDNRVLYIQRNGAEVRDLGFNLESDGYKGDDLSILIGHLLGELAGGKTIASWAYAKIPNSIIWCVRSDGVLLGLTYLRTHQVWGWHRHDTDGEFEDVAAINEGAETAVYFVVKRQINGATVRSIERLHTRAYTFVKDAFFVDSGLSLDVPIAITSITAANPPVVTSATHGFINGDLVDIDETEESSRNIKTGAYPMHPTHEMRYKVANKTDTTFELTDQFTGANIDGSAWKPHRASTGDVRATFTVVAGLNHLEGETLAVLADGSVEELTVSGGEITLGNPAARVHAGLPYYSDMQDFDIERESPRGSAKGGSFHVSELYLQVHKSRGFKAGTSADDLHPAKWRGDENWGEPTKLLTGRVDMILSLKWTDGGSLFIRQEDPLPLSILEIAREVLIGSD